MFSLISLAATVSPAPGEEPTLRPGLDPAQVTPGLLGFLATLFLVVAVIFLIRDMTRRIRRVRYREMAREEAEREALGGGGLEERPDVPGEARKGRAPGGKYGPDSP
ncbi:hypothetical protein GC088_04205 [Arthrobacter sp. JZ12]|uniref:hypothetical protein n=1 Tax=Arthrobacter sp. JZ12 TaxID=2654190 RepID=UPI002B4708E9|nr:hypothetical protein [Arthrobacter sp. JZ12]WRH24369.1 hypothetical protein GC088_04205 [Arthrobacter sp. JZ12]